MVKIDMEQTRIFSLNAFGETCARGFPFKSIHLRLGNWARSVSVRAEILLLEICKLSRLSLLKAAGISTKSFLSIYKSFKVELYGIMLLLTL